MNAPDTPNGVLSLNGPEKQRLVVLRQELDEVNDKGQSLQIMVAGNRELLAERDRLAARMKEIYDPRPDKIIFVKGDPTVKYYEVIHAMDVARGPLRQPEKCLQGKSDLDQRFRGHFLTL